MIDFIWQYGFNMKMPLTVIAILTALIGSVVIYDTRRAMVGVDKASSDWGILEWRVWTSVNVIVFAAIAWLLVMAIPSPTFKREYVTQYKDRVVERKIVQTKWRDGKEVVYKVPTYEQAYKLCVDSTQGYNPEGCHKQATEASLPLPRVLTRTMYMRDPYDVAFKKCMDEFRGYTTVDEVKTCQQFALHKPINVQQKEE